MGAFTVSHNNVHNAWTIITGQKIKEELTYFQVAYLTANVVQNDADDTMHCVQHREKREYQASWQCGAVCKCEDSWGESSPKEQSHVEIIATWGRKR